MVTTWIMHKSAHKWISLLKFQIGSAPPEKENKNYALNIKTKSATPRRHRK